jgi:PAS domain S-box-containing protein
VAPKRNGQTNGSGVAAGVKARVAEPDGGTARASPTAGGMQRLLDPGLFADPQVAANFISSVLEASTEYSIIGNDLEGNIQLWNEGARRIYGYETEEVVGKANSSILHPVEDVAAGLPQRMMATALETGKFEGTVLRKRKNGTTFTARPVSATICSFTFRSGPRAIRLIRFS